MSLFWPSVIYVFLATASLVFWNLGSAGSCPEAVCGREVLLLGRGLWLWGAFFYSLAALGCLALRRRREFSYALLAGALLHWAAIAMESVSGAGFCPVCARFAGLETLAALLALFASSHRPATGRPFWTAGPLRALILASLALLAANPHAGGRVRSEPPLHTATPGFEVGPLVQEEQEGCGRTLTVVDAAGNPIVLDLAECPVLVFAWWCSHCNEALREVAAVPPSRRPRLAAAWSRGEGDAERTREKLAACGLAEEPYFILENPAAAGVRGVPCLIVWEDGGRKVLTGGALHGRLGSLAARLLGRAEVPNPPDAGGRNALRAAAFIDGAVVPPGSEFSFNRAAGPYVEERGYVVGTSVVEGTYGLEYAPDVGGGVCRAATALYRAALAAGMEIAERRSHGLPVWYAEHDGDAAVAWPHWDFRFRNTLGVPVEIRFRQEGGALAAEVWEAARAL
jgi:hypothetical protein